MIQHCSQIKDVFQPTPAAAEGEYVMAGLAVRLRYETAALKQQIAPAFEHLEAPSRAESPELTISLCQSSHVPAWTAGLNEILVSEDHNSITIRQCEGNTVSRLENNGTATWSTSNSESIPYLHRAVPLHHLLNLSMGLQGRYVVHSAAVAHAGQGVLILGKGGAGKSTTAVSCAAAGMQYAGDDYCLVTAGNVPRVFSLYSTAKLAFAGFRRFQPLLGGTEMLGRGQDDKVICCLHRVSGVKISAGFPLKAILLARILDKRTSRLVRASNAQGFRALAPNLGLQLLPHLRTEALSAFNSLARQVPIYDLELGRELASAPAAIQEFLATY
jgi:hypothetical protein